MARRLNPFTGSVDEIDDAVAGLYDEVWERVGGTPAPVTSPVTSGSLQAPNVTPDVTAKEPPAPRKRASKLIVPWSAETCAKVRDGLPGRYQALVDTGQGLGLRFGELSALATEDLDRGHVLVRRQVKRVGGCLVWALPKGGKQRVLPLDKNLDVILRDHQARFPPAPVTLPWDTPDGTRETFRILFSSQSGTPTDRAYVGGRLWHTAVAQAGMIPSRTTGTHQLRHHFASELVGKGTDLETVRRLLGHADLLTIQRYIHSLAISDQQARRAVAKVTPKPKPAPALPAGVADLNAWRARRNPA